MKMIVLTIVGGGDLGQQAGNHLDDIRDGHGTDLILLPYLLFASQREPRAVSRAGEDLFASKTLDVTEVANLDATGRGCS